MEFLHLYPTEILILLFLIITFGISFIEKLTNWKGTLSYITKTFEATFIKNFVKPLIIGLIILEICTLLFLLFGIYQLFFLEEKEFGLLGCYFSCLSILYMLIGQRIAKDYPGATSLTVYFILSVFGVFILSN
ncbi:DoxX family protein [Flavicella sp.]|uniref:DoxX family protein n=1 Tax=Flavicella sp. TaxID=2957742 RepID=UPI00301B5BC2